MPEYAYLIRHADWDSDRHLPVDADGRPQDPEPLDGAEHGDFARLVRAMGARIAHVTVLQSARHGGVVRGGGPAHPHAAVATDGANPELTEVVSGIYLVDCADDAEARCIAALVPVDGGEVEWRRVMPLD